MRSKIILLLAVLVLTGCDPEDAIIGNTGSVSFVVNESGLGAGRTASHPESVIISIQDLDGKSIRENTVLTLSKQAGGKFMTEPLMLDIGKYHLTKYLVVSSDEIAYATPRTGADKATLVDLPLPLDLAIDRNSPAIVTPTIISVSSHDTPAAFGYPDFDRGGPNVDEEFMSVRVKFELIVGGVFYKYADAQFVVTGFDQDDSPLYNQVFQHTGPQPSDLRIETGYHHYTIEAKAWNWSQSLTFTEAELYQWRVRPGVVPLTRVYSYTTEPRRMHSTITSFERTTGGVRTMVPESKTAYHYNGSKLTSINLYTFSTEEGRFRLTSQRELVYEGNRVARILTAMTGMPDLSAEDVYTYNTDGRVSHIQNKSLASGLTTDVDITYGPQDRRIKASYRLSNGGGFEYEFDGDGGNIQNDKTLRGSELCSDGMYNYDRNINPLKHLGFTDYLFRNYSSNNRVAEQVNYTGCAFPSLVPDSHSYTYDSHGYPTVSTTIYKGSGLRSQVQYFYEE